MNAQKLLDLFAGDLTKYIKVTIIGDLNERNKKSAKYITVDEPVTTDLWQSHLDGKQIIGIRPEFNDKCKWACIDIDPADYKDYSEKKYVEIIKNHKLPLVPVKSKSGGLHLFLFLTDWADKNKVVNKLQEINKEYFLSKEVFPCNKAVGMPYYKWEAAVEYAYDDDNNAVILGRFLEIAESKKLSPEDFFKFKVTEYEPETFYREYPPCIQKVLHDGWTGDRNNMLFNICVLELKKSEGTLTLKQLKEVAWERQRLAFAKHKDGPLLRNESDGTAESVFKKGYEYMCPPKYGFIESICNKELCKTRRLGIMAQTPDIFNEFENVTYSQDTKTTYYEFDYKDTHIVVLPEDMKDEKTWRTKLIKHKIFWRTLPKSKKGPPLFELLMEALVNKAEESKDFNNKDTREEIRHVALKDFFEKTWELDDFSKMDHGYTIRKSDSTLVYFKRSTLDSWIKRNASHLFSSTVEALNFLGCKRHDFFQGVKNVWYVDMPDFEKGKEVKANGSSKKTTSEMDDDYHNKFRTPKTKSTIQENN